MINFDSSQKALKKKQKKLQILQLGFFGQNLKSFYGQFA